MTALPNDIIAAHLPSESAFITDEYVDGLINDCRWSSHGASLDSFVEDMSYHDSRLEGLDPHDARSLPALRAVITEWLPRRYRHVAKCLADEIREWPATIRRVVYLKAGDIDSLRKGTLSDIGRHWGTGNIDAWGVLPPDSSEPLQEVVVTATVWPDDVDWTETLRSRFDYENGDIEQEIFVADGATPQVTSIEVATLHPVSYSTFPAESFSALDLP